ncbi:MAG TPA: hypothetical protein VF164_09180 [Trueperaceae bacterium]
MIRSIGLRTGRYFTPEPPALVVHIRMTHADSRVDDFKVEAL